MKYLINKKSSAMRMMPLRLFYYLVGKLYDYDERIAMSLYDYFPTYRAAFGEFMNQWRRMIGSDISYAVQGVVIEPTNACNLKCKHCTAQVIPGEKGYMDLMLYRRILNENPQITSIILTRNGEPFLHPRLIEMIEYARSRNVYVITYTNGALLNDDIINRIFASGLNELNFSLEGVGKTYEDNRGVEYEKCAAVIRKIVKTRNDSGSTMKIGINTVMSDNGGNLADVKKEWSGIVDHITSEPLMGLKSLSRRSACRTLWRNAVITWNGDVIVCCSDMHNRLKVGNLKSNALGEVFNGPLIRELRRRHLKKDFPDICRNCHPHFG